MSDNDYSEYWNSTFFTEQWENSIVLALRHEVKGRKTNTLIDRFDDISEFKAFLQNYIDNLNEDDEDDVEILSKLKDFQSKIDDKTELASVLKSYCDLRNSLS